MYPPNCIWSERLQFNSGFDEKRYRSCVARNVQNMESGVLRFTADGQWIQHVSQDSTHEPLTIVYPFQRDFWDITKHFSKLELLKKNRRSQELA